MEISSKYISTTDKLSNLSSKNVILSDDAFAIAEFINNLTKEISTLNNILVAFK